MAIVIERKTAPDEVATQLVEELEAELAAHYPPEQRHGLAVAALFQSHIHFFVATHEGAPVGCGGVALFGSFAEVKRMYVRPGARGLQVAQALLARIEDEVRGAGILDLKLETGTEQHAALRFYEKCGFRRCEAFGAYVGMPHDQVVGSVFMEKPLPPVERAASQ